MDTEKGQQAHGKCAIDKGGLELDSAGVNDMINTSACATSQQSSNIMDDQFITIMTNLFIEGLAFDHLNEHNTSSLMQPSHIWESNNEIWHYALSYTKETEAIALKEFGTRKAEPRNTQRRRRNINANKSVRTFILGLSDAFNNLLMGIWGNLSLINLTIDRTNPIFQYVTEMEHLIQNGSAMINGIFGYLGERRIVSKNIRLNRLLQELNETLPIDGFRIKEEILRASRIIPSGRNHAATIADSLSRMLMQLMKRIQKHYQLISSQKSLDKALRIRLDTIDRLMNRGLHIITLLECYAGTYKFSFAKVSVKPMIKRLVRQFGKNNPRVKLALDLSEKLPLVRADRTMLEFVLHQIIENAATAMPNQGNLHIDIKTLASETSRNRCVAYRWADSLVVTVTDSGCGMDHKTLLHIFDPFFSAGRSTNRLGMGLASCWGIIKSHKGYIHVRSKSGHGSTFKIYLPIGRELMSQI